MPVYEFICRTPGGKEVTGQCKAADQNLLAAELRKKGLLLLSCKMHGSEVSPTVVSPDFSKEVGRAITKLREGRRRDAAQSRISARGLMLLALLAFLIVILYVQRARLLKEKEKFKMESGVVNEIV